MESKNQNWFDRLENSAPLILTWLILLMFLVGSLVLKAHPIQLDSGETKTWWGIATNLTRGYGYSLCNQYYFPFCDAAHSATAMREPAPVLFFAGVAALTHESLFVAGIVQLFFLVGILIALFFLTLEWTKSPLAALVAALLWTIYPRAYTLITQVSGDLMAGLGVTVGMLFVLRARRTDHFRDWILAGAGLALAFMSRSAMLMAALTILAGLILERWKLKSRGIDLLRPSLIVGAMLALFLTPWLIRTDLVFGRPLIGSSLVGYNIFRHNYALTTDNYFHNVGNVEGWQAIQDLVARRADLTHTENEAQMDLVYRAEGLKIIAAHPVRYVLLSGYRFFMLWFDWRVSEAFGYPMGFNEYAMIVVQVVLLALAFIGLWKNLKITWVLWASLVMVTLAYMAVDSRMHYTSPIMPLVMSLSAAGVMRVGKLKRDCISGNIFI